MPLFYLKAEKKILMAPLLNLYMKKQISKKKGPYTAKKPRKGIKRTKQLKDQLMNKQRKLKRKIQKRMMITGKMNYLITQTKQV